MFSSRIPEAGKRAVSSAVEQRFYTAKAGGSIPSRPKLAPQARREGPGAAPRGEERASQALLWHKAGTKDRAPRRERPPYTTKVGGSNPSRPTLS